MRVHCARGNDAVVTPDIVEQTVTFLNATTSLYERAQKFKFKLVRLTRLPLTETSKRAGSIVMGPAVKRSSSCFVSPRRMIARMHTAAIRSGLQTRIEATESVA